MNQFWAERTVSFIKSVLPRPGAKILDVGAGDGTLTLGLRAAGYDVFPIDSSEKAVERARANGVSVLRTDVRELELTDRFDAVLFSMSAHHVQPFEPALERVHSLLQPGGQIILEEFDTEAADETSARWFYGAQRILAAADLFREPVGGAEDWVKNPLKVWREDHEHDGVPLSTGEEMLVKVGSRFEITSVERGPYFFRYLAAQAEKAGRPSEGLSRNLFALEKQLIAAQYLRPLGLRLVGRKT
jgi:SAM-dependent methyltransferase